eukprot:3699468-Prymnesium_polylepis.1
MGDWHLWRVCGTRSDTAGFDRQRTSWPPTGTCRRDFRPIRDADWTLRTHGRGFSDCAGGWL